MPDPQTEPPLEHSRPSGAHALPGASGFHGSMPAGHSRPQTYVGGTAVVSQVQSGPGGGPQHAGGHVDASMVPGGHCHAPPEQIGSRPASLPHERTQYIGPVPGHPPSPSALASAPASSRTCEVPHEQPARKAKESVTRVTKRDGRESSMRAGQQPACQPEAPPFAPQQHLFAENSAGQPSSRQERACADVRRPRGSYAARP